MFIPANVDIPTFQELARQIIRDLLNAPPGATKDRIYDALVSSMYGKGQMEADDFEGLLKLAEEVQHGGEAGSVVLAGNRRSVGPSRAVERRRQCRPVGEVYGSVPPATSRT